MVTSSQKPNLTDPLTHNLSHLQIRRPLQVLMSYRLLLATILTLLFFTQSSPSIFGSENPQLFSIVAPLYVGLVLLSGVLIDHLPRLPGRHQVFLMVFVDIFALTLLMHASGGVKTGLGMLIGVSIVAGSLIIRGRWAGLLSAIAALSILAEQVYSHLILEFTPTNYTQAGLLGASFFAIALLSIVFARQIQKSEALVSQAETDLHSMEHLNEYVIQHMQTGILVIDNDQNIRLMNEAAWHLIGMPDKGTGDHLSQVCSTLQNQLNERGLDYSKESLPFRATPGGRELTAGFSGLDPDGDAGIIIFLEDAATVAQQAQQMKLASLGRLTASIAHEIRNPLGAISHAEQLLRESPDLPTGDRRLIDIIQTNALRVNEVIETILSLSRRNRPLPEAFILKPWLESVVAGLTSSFELADHSRQVHIAPADTLVRTDQAQLKQVLSILCDNAVKHFNAPLDALLLQCRGGITRETGSPFIDIIDNGPGISRETENQIFEPFFTTENAGTGLGLYIAKELCESNKLGLEYIRPATAGCCFRITFPGRGNKPITS